MEQHETLYFNIEGEDVHPETVSLKDLATVALFFERAVRLNVDGGATERDDLHLTGVADGSLALTMQGKPRIAKSAVKVAKAIGKKDLSKLKPGSRRAIEELVNYGRSRGWSYSLSAEDLLSPVKFNWENVSLPVPIKAVTTIYGKLLRVGGKEPKATLRTQFGELSAVLMDEQMASQLGSRLYSWVGLEGEATYDARDWSISKFTVRSISSFVNVTAGEAFTLVANAAGPIWDDINPEDYVRSIREDDAA